MGSQHMKGLAKPSTRRRRAVTYLRVSGKSQVTTEYDPEGISLPAQRRSCHTKAQQLDVDLVGEYVEPGQSAYKDIHKREAFAKMLRRIERDRDVDVVIVYKLSRFARSRYDDAVFVAALRKLGVTLVSATENIDETPVGELLHGVLAAVNQFQSAASGEDIAYKMGEKARIGGTPGRAPIGYLNTTELYDGRSVRTVVLDPDRWEHIRWAFEEFSAGRYTVAGLTHALETRGLTNRATARFPERPLHKSHVHKMLTNPYYVGVVTFAGVRHEKGRHPTFVTQETFDRVQALLHSRYVTGEKPQKHFHYLKGWLACGRCGSRVGIMNARGQRGGIYPYFYCGGRQRGICSQPYVPINVIEQRVEDYWTRITLTTTQRDEIAATVRQAVGVVAQRSNIELTRQRRNVATLEHERRMLMRAFYAGSIEDDLLQEEQTRIGQALASARRVLTACETAWDNLDQITHDVLSLCDDSHTLYRTAPETIKQHLNQAVFRRFWIIDDTIGGADLHRPLADLLGHDLPDRLTHEITTLTSTDPTPTPRAHAPRRTITVARPHGPLPVDAEGEPDIHHDQVQT